MKYESELTAAEKKMRELEEKNKQLMNSLASDNEELQKCYNSAETLKADLQGAMAQTKQIMELYEQLKQSQDK